jgi:hypothetical protein
MCLAFGWKSGLINFEWACVFAGMAAICGLARQVAREAK